MVQRMTWEQFSKLYCNRQEQTPKGLAQVLQGQVRRFDSRGFMLLQCEQLDSSTLGQYTILGFGGTHSYANIPDHPISPRGLASDMSVVQGYIGREDVPE